MSLTKTQTVRRPLTLLDRYYRLRSSYWRWHRLLFLSAAEIKFVMLMGGHVVTIPGIRTRRGSNLTLVWLGQTLRRYKFKREVRVGRYYADFCNDVGWTIEIDGRQHDVVADFDRDIYLRARCCRILRVPAYRLWNDPGRAYRDVLAYITQ